MIATLIASGVLIVTALVLLVAAIVFSLRANRLPTAEARLPLRMRAVTCALVAAASSLIGTMLLNLSVHLR